MTPKEAATALRRPPLDVPAIMSRAPMRPAGQRSPKAVEKPEQLSDEPNPPPPQKSWGFHLLVDMSGCNDKMDNEPDVEEFFAELVKKLDMETLTPLILKRVEGEDGRGLSAMQMITTSSITFHGDDDRRCVYLDIFSCKTFDEDDALELVEQTFEPKHIGHQMIYRDAGHNVNKSK